MDQEWNESIANNYDVIVTLVQRSNNISALAFADPDSPTMEKDKARKRTRSSNLEEEEQNLGALHVNSNQLRRCSKYFDTCLAERWTGTKIITPKTPMHLTLDVYTDVKYYRDCFLRMSSQYTSILNVNHCLELLQVASQIIYVKLIEDCICYLTSIPWSDEDEKKIQQFANSIFYPLECTTDLNARLGLLLNNTDRPVLVVDITEQTLCKYFDDFLRSGSYYYKQLFFSHFQLIIARPCQSFVENVLQHVNVCTKQLILEAKEHPLSTEGLYTVRWALMLLLEIKLAKGLVECIVDESPLNEMLKTSLATWQDYWKECIFSLFQDMVEGHLLLKTSTRYKLIKDWTWILFVREKTNRCEDLEETKVYKILSTFVMTFPYKIQKEIILDWVANFTGPSQKESSQLIMDIQEKWFNSLKKKICSLQL